MAQKNKPDSELPVILFEDQKAWEEWLAVNFASAAGIWLRLANKSAKFQTVTYQEAVEVALCYGWIDSQAKGYDEESHLQKFTRRGPKSIWSNQSRQSPGTDRERPDATSRPDGHQRRQGERALGSGLRFKSNGDDAG